jgi:hypothetical protein
MAHDPLNNQETSLPEDKKKFTSGSENEIHNSSMEGGAIPASHTNIQTGGTIQSDFLSIRFPELGKLSISVLETLFPIVIGESAITEIKSPLKEKELRDMVVAVLQKAEKRFLSEYDDLELIEIIINLPIIELQSTQQAILAYWNNPKDSSFRSLLQEQLTINYPNISRMRIEKSLNSYLSILIQ